MERTQRRNAPNSRPQNEFAFHGPAVPPTQKPAYHRVVPAQDGRLWVWLHTRSERVPGAETLHQWREVGTAFDIVHPDGSYIGNVSGPAGIRPLSIRGDTMLALAKHELGVDRVIRFVVRWDD